MNGRFSTLATMLGRIAVLVAPIVAEPVPLYVWNASERVPLGLYRLRPADRLFVTELVAVQPPEPLATFLDLNGYCDRYHTRTWPHRSHKDHQLIKRQITVAIDLHQLGRDRAQA